MLAFLCVKHIVTTETIVKEGVYDGKSYYKDYL